MVVYAKAPYTYVYGQHYVGHKQGKAFPPRPLNVIGAWGDDDEWLEISPLVLDRPIDTDYKSYWVVRDEVDEGLIPPVDPPSSDAVSDGEAAVALLVILRWFKQ